MNNFSNFDKLNGDLIRWLKKLFAERMGKDIKLTLRSDLVTVSCIDRSGSISITEHNNEFYRVGGEIAYSTCSFSEFRSINAEFENCPCPGRIDTHQDILEEDVDGYNLNYDVLGLIFWKLSLIEETEINVRDVHQRVCGKQSHAYKHNYLPLPIIDMWFSILQTIAKLLWPEYQAPESNFKITPTHDIDRPAKYQFQPKFRSIKLLSSEQSLKNISVNLFDILLTDGASQSHLRKNDPFNTFDWIMRQSELRALRSEFYLLSGKNSQQFDADFDLNYPSIRTLARSIVGRGHLLGIHPSYYCYKDEELCKSEIANFKNLLASESIGEQNLFARMHYLRWLHPLTMRILSEHGVTHDSTLGYHDCAGFRCGTCYEYTAIEPSTKEILPVRIRPLIAMESTLLPVNKKTASEFEKLYSTFLQLKKECQNYKGNFIFLWHNSELYNEPLRNIYTSVLDS